MEPFWIVVVGIVAASFVGMLYTIFTDPARISEEEEAEVAAATPRERRGFLRYFRRKPSDIEDRIKEQGMAEFSDAPDTSGDESGTY